MQEVLVAAAAAAEDGRAAALVTPVARVGSVPAGRQARMLVTADGTGSGTVGGGALEQEARQAALAALADGRSRLARFVLDADDPRADGLLCGGEASLLVEPLSTASGPALRLVADCLAGNRPCVEMVRLAAGEPVLRLVVDAAGGTAGTLGSATLDLALAARANEFLTADTADVIDVQTDVEQAQVFVQAVQSRPVVYIFGGGHVGLALARLVPSVQMEFAVVDDRPEYCSRERFPRAWRLFARQFDVAMDDLGLGPNSAVVVVTHGHQWDREVVSRALRTPAGYVGMIGSRRKISLIWAALREEGFGDSDLARVHAPIGLDIGGDSPGEIALSIVAELVHWRRRGPTPAPAPPSTPAVAGAVAMLHKVDTSKDLETACAALQAAVVAHQFGVLHVHDLKETMARKGVEFPSPCRVFEICNPHQARKVLEQDLDLATALPCRIAVYVRDGVVTFATLRPTVLMELFGRPGLGPVAAEVEASIDAIMAAAAAPA